MAGTSWLARRFPVRIGRALSADLRIEEPGVWDDHLVLELQQSRTFSLSAQPGAIVSVNGAPTAQALLKNGDTIELGVVKLQFWLNPARQRRLRFLEAFAWAVFILVTLGEITLVYWLLQ